MKIQALSYQDMKRRLEIPFKNLDNTVGVQTDNTKQRKADLDKLYDYAFVKTYYNQKLDNNGKLFDEEKSFSKVMADPKAKANLIRFMRERAQTELLELNNKPGLSAEEKEKAERETKRGKR